MIRAGPGRMAPLLAAVPLAFGPFAPATARCQPGSLLLDAGFSYSLPPASVTAESTPYLFLGGRLGLPLGDRASWSLSGATGLSLVSEGSSWLSLGTAAEGSVPVSGALWLDLSLGGEVFSVGDPYPYDAGLLELEPAARFTFAATTLRLVGRGAIGRSRIPVNRRTEVVTDLWSWGGRLELWHRFPAVEPRLRLEGYSSTQGEYYGISGGARFSIGGSLCDLDLGLWETPTGSEFLFALGLFLPLGPDLAFRGNGGRYAPDPLLDTPAAGSAGAVLSWTALRFGAEQPQTYRIEEGAPAQVRFHLEAPNATTVELVADFLDWESLPMLRGADGWVVTVLVEPGLHRFGFLVDGTWHLPDEIPGRTIDEWGREQATLVVTEP
ncbi:MAG: hypothetical protein M8844_04160 [marine benthic group bacterium]|nr:hypothetical protein [Gemmatimonadota bacterium]MCL7976448.1 hypothetical protein [Gemmatimonadota bacterium]